jgi:hypothetical protein
MVAGSFNLQSYEPWTQDAQFPMGIGWGGGWMAGGEWWGFGFSRKWTCREVAGLAPARVAVSGVGRRPLQLNDLQFGVWTVAAR